MSDGESWAAVLLALRRPLGHMSPERRAPSGGSQPRACGAQLRPRAVGVRCCPAKPQPLSHPALASPGAARTHGVQRRQQRRLPRIRRAPGRGQSELALPCGGSHLRAPSSAESHARRHCPCPRSSGTFRLSLAPQTPGAPRLLPPSARRPQAHQGGARPCLLPSRTACCPCSGPGPGDPTWNPPTSMLWPMLPRSPRVTGAGPLQGPLAP